MFARIAKRAARGALQSQSRQMATVTTAQPTDALEIFLESLSQKEFKLPKNTDGLEVLAKDLKALRLEAEAAANAHANQADGEHDHYDFDADMATRPTFLGAPLLRADEVLPIHHHHPDHRIDGSFDHRNTHFMSVYEYYSPKGGYGVAPPRAFTLDDFVRCTTGWDWRAEYESDVKFYGEAKDRDASTDIDAIGYKMFAREMLGVDNRDDPDFAREDVMKKYNAGKERVMANIKELAGKNFPWYKYSTNEELTDAEGTRLITAYAAAGMFGPTGMYNPPKPIGLRMFIEASPLHALYVAISLGSAAYMVGLLYGEWVHYFAHIDDYVNPTLHHEGAAEEEH